jgi:hypothetical protein
MCPGVPQACGLRAASGEDASRQLFLLRTSGSYSEGEGPSLHCGRCVDHYELADENQARTRARLVAHDALYLAEVVSANEAAAADRAQLTSTAKSRNKWRRLLLSVAVAYEKMPVVAVVAEPIIIPVSLDGNW